MKRLEDLRIVRFSRLQLVRYVIPAAVLSVIFGSLMIRALLYYGPSYRFAFSMALVVATVVALAVPAVIVNARIRDRERQAVLRGLYLGVLCSFIAIPVGFLFGSRETRSDRLWGSCLAIAVYSVATVLIIAFEGF